MIVERIIGHISEPEFKDVKTVNVNISFDHAHKRIQRLTAEDGKEFGLRLNEEDRQKGLEQGDILFFDQTANTCYCINIDEEEVLCIHILDEAKAMAVAYVIGNRHARLYQGRHPFELLCPYEKTMEDMLASIKEVRLSRDHRKLLAEDSLMAILPQGAYTHNHDHDHEH